MWSSHLAGAPTVVVESPCRVRSYGLALGEKRYQLKVYLQFYLSVDATLLVQK